ncbi:MAG: cell division protein FtsQ/DivIB [Peptostreptococcaceae bacterium]
MKTKKRKRKVNTGRLMILLSLIFMMIIGIYAFLNSSIFHIKDIEIQGNNKIAEEEVKSALEIREDKNIFMYNTNKMEEKIKENTYIEDVSVKKVLPSSIIVNIKEKEIVGLLRDEDKYSYIDKEGNIIDNLSEIDENENNIIIDIDYNIDENNTLKFKNEEVKKGLLYLLECINDNNLQKKINNINYQKDDIINMYTKDGVEIILDNNKELKYNISRSSAILVDLQGENAKGGVIDLTCGEYAVYRP